LHYRVGSRAPFCRYALKKLRSGENGRGSVHGLGAYRRNGINYAGFGDWVLLGFEGDFAWSGASGTAGCSVLGPTVLGASATCQTRIDWLTTFRLRAGYTCSHFLFYATAGGAAGDFRISSSPSGANHNPTAPLGWTAGAGIEYLFTDAISAKLEYLYVNLGSVSCPTTSTIAIGQPTLPSNLCNADNMTKGR
jgi:outer membrane immunogenic protein